jgi:hypothetical protein
VNADDSRVDLGWARRMPPIAIYGRAEQPVAEQYLNEIATSFEKGYFARHKYPLSEVLPPVLRFILTAKYHCLRWPREDANE